MHKNKLSVIESRTSNSRHPRCREIRVIMRVLEVEPCLNRLLAGPRDGDGGAEQGRSGACPPATPPRASRDLVPWQGRASLTDSGTFRWPAGALQRQTPCSAAGSRSCSGRCLSRCTSVHVAVQVSFRESETVPSLRLRFPAADEISTSSLYPRPLGGGSLHTPVLASPQRGSAQLLCPGVDVVRWSNRRRIEGRSQWEASVSGPSGKRVFARHRLTTGCL